MNKLLAIVLALVLTSLALSAEPPPNAAIVSIDLEQSIIRVAASPEHVYPYVVLADIGFCEMLTKPLAPKQQATKENTSVVIVREGQELIDAVQAGFKSVNYVEMATKLASGDEFHGAFQSNIPGVTVGILAKRVDRRDQALVEIRPMYTLPSGKVLAFSRRTGMSHLRSLSRALGKARAAKAAIPNLDKNLQVAKAQWQQYQQALAKRQNLQTIKDFASNVPNPRAQAQAAYQRGVVLTKQLARARILAAQLPSLEKDAEALLAVARYGAAIAPEAKVYVRLYARDVSLETVVYGQGD